MSNRSLICCFWGNKTVNNTKSRILDAALISFAEKGYKGTNLRDLAADSDLTKSALYRHFESKEAIWNAVIDMMEDYYAKHFGSPENMPKVPKTCEELIKMTMEMLNFTVNDQRVILTRQLLLTEQFHDERARKLTTLHFLTGTKDIYKKVFEEMMSDGILKKGDPEMLAFAYTSPISALVQLCDREPEKKPEIMRYIEMYLNHFIKTYAKE